MNASRPLAVLCFTFLATTSSFGSQANLASLKDCAETKKCFVEPGANAAFKMIHSPKSDAVVLLMHGLSDSPYFMKDVGARMFARGYDVIAPMLDGHGTKVEDLLKVTSAQWIATSEAWFSVAQKQWKNVSVGGFSTGGMLAIRLAGLYPGQVKHISLFAPAVKIASTKSSISCPFTSAAQFAKSLPFGRSILETPLKWINPNGEIVFHTAYVSPVKYGSMTTASVCALYTLTTSSLSYLSKMKAPITAVVSGDDETIDPIAQVSQLAQSQSPTVNIQVLASSATGSFSKFEDLAKRLRSSRKGLVIQVSDGPKVRHGSVPVEVNRYHSELMNPQFKTLESFVFPN